ncbi:MAG: hypothetical protein NXI16_15570 [Alphaproteobacteria bacterium]|nr:hypothetical protein [Alphaproteobacteria bacterium]
MRETTSPGVMLKIAVGVLWIVAGFYAYGAYVHATNMLGWNGFDWSKAPLKWQILDGVYLVLNVAVVAGLARRKRFGIYAFYLATVSQILLYTVFKLWILDVPPPFTPSLEQVALLEVLVTFHICALLVVSGCLFRLSREGDRRR